MHSEQKVCEQDVRTGVVKKSLQIWQRSAASTVESVRRGLSVGVRFVQSEGSGRVLSIPERATMPQYVNKNEDRAFVVHLLSKP